MKKKIFSIAMTLLFVASAFAFPFRTSCGRVINVNRVGEVSSSLLVEMLEDINYLVCGEDANIVIYNH